MRVYDNHHPEGRHVGPAGPKDTPFTNKHHEHSALKLHPNLSEALHPEPWKFSEPEFDRYLAYLTDRKAAHRAAGYQTYVLKGKRDEHSE